jgi:hypothetical protein
MFGNPTSFNGSSNTDWGEQMLNSVASQTLRHMFTRCDSLEVAVRCYPSSKLLQGSIDSFKVSGHGLTIRKDFRTESMNFETDAVSIDFASIVQGKLRLKQPTQAIAQVILTEADINEAFKAPLVTQHLENIQDEALTNLSGGEPVSFRDIEVTLLPDNGVLLRAKTDLPNRKDLPIALRANLTVTRRRRINFADRQFEADAIPPEVQGLSKLLSDALGTILDRMVDLDRFDLDGVMLRLNRLETDGANLIFSGYAQIERLPQNARG